MIVASGIAQDLVERARWLVRDPAEVERERAVEAQRWRDELQDRERRRLEGRGIPRRLAEHLMSGRLRPTRCLARAVQWVNEIGQQIFVLSGPHGVGKSIAAAWVLSCARTGVWRYASDLMAVGLYDAERLGPFLREDTLVLDDGGVEYSDERGVLRTLIDVVISRRYDDLRRTVITTNMPMSVFRERYGERIIDRIREVGTYFETQGASLRHMEKP